MKRMCFLIATISLCGLSGCADESSKSNNGAANNGANNGTTGGRGDGDNNGVNNGFEPEIEYEFEFARPAVVGTRVFVANETTNTVAVVDSRSLGIRTVPVGFGPTAIAGPTEPATDASRVFVLNEGANSVSVIHPDTLDAISVPVLRGANSLLASPDGRFAVVWFDEERLEAGETIGDLSSVTLVTEDAGAFQIAVGYRVDRVDFVDDGAKALVLTDDGVSPIELAATTNDGLAPPIAVLPPELLQFDRTDREVVVDPEGEWAIARLASVRGLVLTDLDSGEQWLAGTPAIPTDIDLIGEGAGLRLLAMFPGRDEALVATIPAGIVNLSTAMPVIEEVDDVGVGADAGSDAGGSDVGLADTGAVDAGGLTDMSDAGLVDSGTVDGGAPDAGGDGGDSIDMAPPTQNWAAVDGVEVLQIAFDALGAAEVSSDSSVAFLFTTLDDRKGGVLLDLGDLSQRQVAFEKGVRGAISDPDGETFVVFHTRAEGAVPVGATPADPEFIARSWGISILDVASGATRLVLTEQEPGDAVLWSADGIERLYMIFVGPRVESEEKKSHRDVLRVDLQTFSTETFRVPSLPEGLGSIPEAGSIYVDQIHPQGRLTFVDVATDERQTVTGYQLNSGID